MDVSKSVTHALTLYQGKKLKHDSSCINAIMKFDVKILNAENVSIFTFMMIDY